MDLQVGWSTFGDGNWVVYNIKGYQGDGMGFLDVTCWQYLSVLVFPGPGGATHYGMFRRSDWDSMGVYGYFDDYGLPKV